MIVLADGAGTAAHAHEGAQIAVDSALTTLSDELRRQSPFRSKSWKPLMKRVILAAQTALIDRSPSESLREYATTLTCVVATSRHLVIAQIGDAMVAAQAQSGEMFTCMPPQQGEYANQTYFITHDRALELVDFRYYPITVKAVMATTDALLAVATDLNGEPSHLFWQPFVRRIELGGQRPPASEEFRSFLQSKRICARVDDDKTLVVATRTEIENTEPVGGGCPC